MPRKYSLRAGISVQVYCGHLELVWSLLSCSGGLGGGEIGTFSRTACFIQAGPTNVSSRTHMCVHEHTHTHTLGPPHPPPGTCISSGALGGAWNTLVTVINKVVLILLLFFFSTVHDDTVDFGLNIKRDPFELTHAHTHKNQNSETTSWQD